MISKRRIAKLEKSYQIRARLIRFYCAIPAGYGGVYRIRNKRNNQCYIGASKNLRARMSTHANKIAFEAQNKLLQAAVSKYGPEVFVFEVILFCEPEWLDFYESALIRLRKPKYNFWK